MYIPGTLTPSNTWQDAAQSTLNANPVALDANGCAIMYGIGTYRQVVYDSLGNVVWDKNTSVSPIVLFAGTSTGTPNVQAVTAAAFTSGNGQQIIYKANLANTGPMTLSVNGGGAIAVNKDNPTVTALTGGEISAGSIVTVTYDSVAGYFHLANINNTILASGNTPFTGNNTHAGTETFNGPAIFNSTTTLTGATTIANNTSATFNGPVNYNEQTLTVTANATTWNMALGPDAYVTNSTNLTFNAPTNVPANGRGYLRINNTASGPIQLTWNAAFAAFTNGSPLPTYIPPGITYLQYDVNSGTVNINYSPAQPGGWIELNKITISNQATVSDTTSFLLGFAEYEITFQNVVPVTNSVGFKFQPYVSGAFQSSITKQSVLSNTGSTGGNQTTNGGFTNGTVLNTAGNGVTARFSILNPAYTSGVKYIHFTSSEIVSSGGPQEFETGMMYYSGSNAAVTGFQLLATSGNLSTGTVIVRGRN